MGKICPQPHRPSSPALSLPGTQREGAAYLACRQLLVTALRGPLRILLWGCWGQCVTFGSFGVTLLLMGQAQGGGKQALAEGEQD